MPKRKKQDIPEMEPYKEGLIRSPKGGYEWANHKYITKVKTRSGKIRYIYEDDKGDLVDKSSDELVDIQEDEKEKSRKYYEGEKRRIARNEAGYAIANVGHDLTHFFDSGKYFIQKDTARALDLSVKYIGMEMKNIIDTGKNFLDNLFR